MVANQGLKVFVFCQSGISRAPTLALLYTCLFKRLFSWENINLTSHFIRQTVTGVIPNEQRVQKIITENLVL
jgi:protein-tyrosine phosphatase